MDLCYDFKDTEWLSKSMVSLHAFTGCYTVTTFFGKGKVKPLKVMLKNRTYIEEFAEIGVNPYFLFFSVMNGNTEQAQCALS